MLALGMLAIVMGGASAYAQDAAADETAEQKVERLEALQLDRDTKARKFPLDHRISRYLAKAAEKLDEKDSDGAEALLLRATESRLDPYNLAYVYRMLGVVAYTAEQPSKAIGYFEKVLDLEMLPVRDEAKIRFTIAQLHAQQEKWPEVVEWIDAWRRYVAKPDPAGIYLKALAYFQMGETDAAIVNVKEAIELSPDEPRESWMRMLYSLYTSKEDYDNAIPLLKEMMLRFPKKEYWIQLSLLYRAEDSLDDSLAVLQLAYNQGYLTEDKEIRRLARSYLYHELPYKAAQVLVEGLESGVVESDADAYQVLADSWIAAREYENALPPLRKAAELSDEGNLYARLGQVHLQREEWSEAAAALTKALEKGSLRNTGNAVLLLGIASYNDSQIVTAKRYFARAREYDNTRTAAENWIQHIDREQASEGGQSS
jgi:tetratricopeptide (TPR) repeat protein